MRPVGDEVGVGGRLPAGSPDAVEVQSHSRGLGGGAPGEVVGLCLVPTWLRIEVVCCRRARSWAWRDWRIGEWRGGGGIRGSKLVDPPGCWD